MKAKTIIDNLQLDHAAVRALIPRLRGESGPEDAEAARDELKSLAMSAPEILALIPDLEGRRGPERALQATERLKSLARGG